ncbi:MAG: MJ0042-type zinc finger domain-containing protein [Phycisphaerae bacterium]
MKAIHVKCPSCGATLAVPNDNIRRHVRCGKCKHKFTLSTQPEAVLENVVASWLTDEEEPQPAEKGPEPEDLAGRESVLLGSKEPSEPSTPKKGDIRVVKIERGVLFEFPAGRLLDPDFRSAFPRQCLSCESRAHLRAHVVIYAAQLMQDSISMEDEHSAGTLVLSNEEVQGLSDQEILDRLHHVPNVPHPGELPMPYWVCDMCSGTGQVSGQIQVNIETGKGWCRLLIRSIHRALAFMVNAGGEGAEGYDRLKERVEKTAENPWDNLAEVVQHRIQQWFRPQGPEQFVAFVPDRDHVRTEDGVAGVLISSTRLIFHNPRRHWEMAVKDPVELRTSTGRGKGSVSITTPSWSIQHMTVDRDGLMRMRRALSLGKFQAVWH